MAEKNFKKRRDTLLALIAIAFLGVTFWHYWQTPAGALTQEEYGKIRDRLVFTTQHENPRVALELLTELSDDERILGSCHGLVHEIGRAAFERYQDVAAALEYSDETCGSGYTHGVIEAYISKIGYSTSKLENLCTGYSDPVERDNCYHGVGHGLMYYSSNNIPSSLASCNEFDDSKGRLRCSEGVFMENFNTDQKLHPSLYLDPVDPFSICRTQKLSYQKGVCYFYAPIYYLSLHIQKYADAFAWCESAEQAFIPTCIKGTASRVMKENIKRPAYAEKVCSKLPQVQWSVCAAGMGSYHFTHFGDAVKTMLMCQTLRSEFQEPCLSAIPDSSNSIKNL